MIANKLTQWLTKAERHQVSEFIANETAMRKALKKRLTKRQPPSADGDSPASRL
jgi:predicted kinase